MTTTVSLIITSFNDGEFLPEAVASALGQTYQPIELLISDDGSTDPTTLSELDRLERAGVRVLRNPHHGVASNRNAGLAAASGTFVLYLDADDRLDPQYVERAVPLLDDPAVGIVAPDWLLFGRARGPRVTTFSLGEMLAGNQLPISCVVRRSDLEAIGGFCPDLPHHEDWDAWLGILGLGRTVAFVNYPAFHRRVRAGQFSEQMTYDVNAAVFGTILRRHQQLYADHADAFWASLLRQRSMLAHFKRRYGRLHSLLQGGVHAVRTLTRARRG